MHQDYNAPALFSRGLGHIAEQMVLPPPVGRQNKKQSGALPHRPRGSGPTDC